MSTIQPAPLLRVHELTKRYPVRRSAWRRNSASSVCTVFDVSFTVNRGEVLGIVGESGSGKTTVARMIARLTDVSSGVVELDGANVLRLSSQEVLTELRRTMRVIFQDPDAVLNPGYPIGEGLARAIRLHQRDGAAVIAERVIEVLAQVGMDASYAGKYPDQLSGGEKRRVGVGRALCTNPALIIADEPLSGLDVMLQEQVLSLLMAEQQRMKFGMILVSHDLDRVHQVCDRVAVMFGGRIVELHTLRRDGVEFSEQYRHPYSQSLQRARVWMASGVAAGVSPVAEHEQAAVAGNSGADRAACVFAGRCEREVLLRRPEACRTKMPPLVAVNDGQEVACHFPEGAE